MTAKDWITAAAFSAVTAAAVMGTFYFAATRYVEISSCGAC